MDNASGTGKSPLPSSTDLAILPKPGSPGPVWSVLAERAAHYATSARRGGTRRTYRSAWIDSRRGVLVLAVIRCPAMPTWSLYMSFAALMMG